MKVIIEGSTLFTKGYTGIPHYIICLYNALKKNSTQQVELGLNIKRYKKRKYLNNEVQSMQKSWYFKRHLFSNLKPTISHSLHSPFLKLSHTKKIATIHDLAVHLPELEKFEFANDYFKKKRFKLFQEIASHADAIISVSENTKKDFLKFFDYPSNQIYVIPLAPVFSPVKHSSTNSEKILLKHSLSNQKYMLTVGGVSLRKNSLNLLKAFANSNYVKTHKLVFAGKIDSQEVEKLNQIIKDKKLENTVLFTNYISDADVSILYSNADAFLFPTYYEGFGIPIIEAMTYKLPVLTSKTGAAPEVANDFATLVNPHDVDEITTGINNILNKSNEEINHAYSYASQFTWDRVAKETSKVYETLK